MKLVFQVKRKMTIEGSVFGSTTSKVIAYEVGDWTHKHYTSNVRWVEAAPDGSNRTAIRIADTISGCIFTYIVPTNHATTIAIIKGEVSWQDEERTWREVDRVYETRWDCLLVPEGVRRLTG